MHPNKALLLSALCLPFLLSPACSAQTIRYLDPGIWYSSGNYYGRGAESTAGVTSFDQYADHVGDFWDSGAVATATGAGATALQSSFELSTGMFGGLFAGVWSLGTNALGHFAGTNASSDTFLVCHFVITNPTPFVLSGEATIVLTSAGSAGQSPNAKLQMATGDRIPPVAGHMVYNSFNYPVGTVYFSFETNGFLESGDLTIGVLASASIGANHSLYENPSVAFNFRFLIAPSLKVTPTTGNGGMVLSWQSVFTNFVLEATSDLTLQGGWLAVTNTPMISTNTASVTIDTSTGPAQFFRMRRL